MKDYKGLKWETFSVWGHVWDYKGCRIIKDLNEKSLVCGDMYGIIKDEGL